MATQHSEALKSLDPNEGFNSLGESTSFNLPERFLLAENGDYEKGLQRWRDTCAWRSDKDADTALDRPHPDCFLIKECYPHFFHGRDKRGNVVYYELPGAVNYPRMKRAGVDKDRFLNHAMFCQEYLWTKLSASQDDRVTLVLDLGGLGLSTLSNKEIVGIIKGCVAMTSTHYPQRSHKMIVANVPGWFGIAFNIVKPLLNDAQRAKINIFRAHDLLDGMRTIIDDDQIPSEYGGSSTTPLGHDEMEQDMRRQVFGNLGALGVPLNVDDEMANPDGTPVSMDKYVYSPKRA